VNRQNLNQIFEAYIQKFEFLNNDKNEESYKWNAVWEFQKVFDLNAPGNTFVGMLREAKKATHNLIDSNRQPFRGLIAIADDDPEKARSLLLDLLEDDGGDLRARQDKIDAFLERCNALIDEVSPGSHLYLNDQRSAMAYMFFFDPENHYLYKATEAKYMADCIGFYDDWGTMNNFKLDIYHRFCDELISEIKACKPIMDIHRSRFEKPRYPMYEDESLHILLFDIIYCAEEYGLYTGLKIDKITATDRKLYQERKAKAGALYAELKKKEQMMALLEEAQSYFADNLKPGVTVIHKTLGELEVIRVSGDLLQAKIKDSGETKNYLVCASIINGLLKFDTDDFEERRTRYQEVLKYQRELPKWLTDAKAKYEPYAKYLS